MNSLVVFPSVSVLMYSVVFPGSLQNREHVARALTLRLHDIFIVAAV